MKNNFDLLTKFMFIAVFIIICLSTFQIYYISSPTLNPAKNNITNIDKDFDKVIIKNIVSKINSYIKITP